MKKKKDQYKREIQIIYRDINAGIEMIRHWIRVSHIPRNKYPERSEKKILENSRELLDTMKLLYKIGN